MRKEEIREGGIYQNARGTVARRVDAITPPKDWCHAPRVRFSIVDSDYVGGPGTRRFSVSLTEFAKWAHSVSALPEHLKEEATK